MEAAELSNASLGGQAEGQGTRAEGRRRTREDAEPGDRGLGQTASRETERAILCILGFHARFC